MRQARAARLHARRTVLRRLNRIEYQNTVRDLLGIDVDFQGMLPADSSANGFDNSGEAMHVSSFLWTSTCEAADTALGLAIANGPQPPVVKKQLQPEKSASGEVVDRERVPHSGRHRHALQLVGMECGPHLPVLSAGPRPIPLPHLRLRGSEFRQAGHLLRLGGRQADGREERPDRLLSMLRPSKPSIVEFVEFMEPRTTIHILPYGLASAQTVHKIGADKYEGPGLAVQWVEIEGPLHETWPPASHRRIFGDLEQKPAPVFNNSKRVEVVSNNPEADAEKILRDFARRAFRRSVTDADVKPFVELVKAKLAAKHSFEKAVRVGLTAIMVSPDFLFLREKPGKLDDFALASRLSYFLWSTMPDEELLTLAEKGKLSQPETLLRQVERMLKHPKAAAVHRELRRPVARPPRDRRHRTEPPALPRIRPHAQGVDDPGNRELFFAEVLEGRPEPDELRGFRFHDAQRPAGQALWHPGLGRVRVPQGDAAAGKPPWRRADDGERAEGDRQRHDHVAGHARRVGDGAHPWERRRQNRPPTCPSIEPDIRGATTIREQLAKHRQVASCASCHAKIDPPGFALESFDVIGGWRDAVPHHRQRRPQGRDRGRPAACPYRMGAKVDPSDAMPDGSKFQNIDEFKQLLLKDKINSPAP